MWPVYVINMAENTERLARVRAELTKAGIEWERLEAVNGRSLSASRLAEVYDGEANRRRARHPLVPGEIGCYLSHLAAWQRLVDSDAPGAIVLEDDFRVDGNLATVLEALERDDGEWELAKLFAFKPVALEGEVRDLVDGVRIGKPRRVPSTTLGYAIRRTGAERLLVSSLPFCRPIDEDHKFYWETGLKIAMVDPVPLAMGTQDTVSGTIGDARRTANRDDTRPWAARVWAGVKYQARYRWGLWRARRS